MFTPTPSTSTSPHSTKSHRFCHWDALSHRSLPLPTFLALMLLWPLMDWAQGSMGWWWEIQALSNRWHWALLLAYPWMCSYNKVWFSPLSLSPLSPCPSLSLIWHCSLSLSHSFHHFLSLSLFSLSLFLLTEPISWCHKTKRPSGKT